MHEALAAELRQLDAAAMRRRAVGRPRGVDWLTNDVFGLSADPAVVAAGAAALAERGAGAGASRLLGGNLDVHEQAEAAAAQWLGAAAALLFPSGWQAAAGVLAALVGPGDALLCDELLHASSIDGARLTKARRLVHQHADVASLAACLQQARGARRRIIVTEGVFSMDGDSPDLAAIETLAREHDAWVVVDEAHSAGVLGPTGQGAWAQAGLRQERLAARIVTGGKALGCAGAFVVGSAALREVMLARARSFLFTTGIPPATAACLRAAMARVVGMEAERAQLRARARELADLLGLPAPHAAIVPIPVGPAERAVALATALHEAGHELSAVRPPTVPAGQCRLRVVLRSSHTREQVQALARAILATGWRAAAARLPVVPRARALWVVGTDTNVGKTVVSAALALALGEDCAYWKPVQTGSERDVDVVRRLVPGVRCVPSRYELPLPASPDQAAAASGTQIELAVLQQALHDALTQCPQGRLIVEPAGGLMVPLDARHLTADWLAAAGGDVVLVARSGLGTLNHTLLTVEALAARGINLRAVVLVGEPHAANRASLAPRIAAPLVELPWLSDLATDLAVWTNASGLAQVLQ